MNFLLKNDLAARKLQPVLCSIFANYKHKAFHRINISKRFFSSHSVKVQSNSKYHESASKIRNIGVIAHVDAGKTTTTERMLYYSGFTDTLGNVDDGNTVMDYMDQERERGITITSAAIVFNWKQHQFNLIDTPGHVDFTVEVERALRVLDGAVAVVDASAGVEAQTQTVWRQSTKYAIPRIVFINKMDKPAADFEMCLQTIEKKLSTVPVALQMPLGKGKDFIGVIDLINMSKMTWDNKESEASRGKLYKLSALNKSDHYFKRAQEKRVELIETLAMVNEGFSEHLLEKYNLNYETFDDNIVLETYLRETALKCQITPVLCGSSYKNISVQPMMDAIIKYLPNPLELAKNNHKYFEDELNSVCFKILHDHQKSRKRIDSSTSIAALETNTKSTLKHLKNDELNEDILTFVRVYSGELVSKSKIYNVNKQVKEACDKIYIPYSNRLKQVSKLTCGNIGIVSGLTKTITGDTLVSTKQSYEKANELFLKDDIEEKGLMLADLDIAQPVYFCTVEPNSEAEEKRLNYALECLQREDPSLKVLINDEENNGQTIIQGMGELHLDIIKTRILKEYNLKAYFGPLNIAFKEQPTLNVTEKYDLNRIANEKKISVQIELDLKITKNFSFDKVKVDVADKAESLKEVPPEYLAAINHGIKSALNKGVLLRYPIVDTDVILRSFNANKGVIIPFISTAAFQCTMNALKGANCVVIQPVMQIEVQTTKEYSHGVYGDLSRRNATDIKINEINDVVKISANVPLAKLASYSTDIRRITSGNTNFTIEFSSYEPVSQREYQELVEKKV